MMEIVKNRIGFVVFGFLIGTLVFFTSCKKNNELPVEDRSTRKMNLRGVNGTPAFNLNVQLKLGVLDSVMLKKIDSLSVIEQKVFWSIIWDIERGNMDNLYPYISLVNSMVLNSYPYPMIDPLDSGKVVPPGHLIMDHINFGMFGKLPNQHLFGAFNRFSSFNELIGLLPLIISYKSLDSNIILYSVAYFSESEPYFNIMLYSSDFVFREELDQIVNEPDYKEESPTYPDRMLSEGDLDWRKFIYDSYPEELKKLHPYYPRKNGNW